MNALIPNALIPQNFDQSLRLVDYMARNSFLPEHLRNNPATCMEILELALRWKMSPYAVAQCSYKVGEKLGYEGKLIHAAAVAVEAVTSDGFEAVYEGEGTSRKITVYATPAGQT
jgi:hypothetical protein